MSITAAEGAIVARIKAQVPGLRDVLTAAEAADVQSTRQRTPAAHVLFAGYEPIKQNQGAAQIRTTWAVVVAVKNTRAPIAGDEARDEAGPFMASIIAALIGWKPAEGHSALQVQAGAPPFYDNGYGYFPLAFTTETTIRQNPA